MLALHDVHHALAHADRIVVLEHGRKVIDEPSSTLTANDLAAAFRGRAVNRLAFGNTSLLFLISALLCLVGCRHRRSRP